MIRFSRTICCFAIGSIFLCQACNTPPVVPQNLAQLQVDDYQRESYSSYNADTLFEYINGEADVFLKRGFEKLHVYTFKTAPGGRAYTVDIYDLGSPAQARKTHNYFKTRHSKSIAGVDGATTDGLTVQMHKQRFFIRILAAENLGTPSRSELKQLALALHQALSG